MIYGLWQSAGGMAAQDYRQTILSNNLANTETPGFKPERVSFQERLNASLASGSPDSNPLLGGISGGVFQTDVYTDFAPAGLEPSSGKLDVALDGPGFLAVHTPQGKAFTRDGRMVMDKNGTLVHSASGSPVLNTEGRRIVLNPASRAEVKIDESGRVTQGDDILGKLEISEFANPQKLRKTGQNLYRAGNAATREGHTQVKQGFFENSGVQPVDALVEMISASRAYQLNANMISLQDQSLGRAVNDVGKIA